MRALLAGAAAAVWLWLRSLSAPSPPEDPDLEGLS